MSQTDKVPPQLVTFFVDNEKGERVVGIGLNDAFIAQLQKQGMILQEGSRTGSGVNVALFYAPTLNEVVKKIQDISPEEMQVKLT